MSPTIWPVRLAAVPAARESHSTFEGISATAAMASVEQSMKTERCSRRLPHKFHPDPFEVGQCGEAFGGQCGHSGFKTSPFAPEFCEANRRDVQKIGQMPTSLLETVEELIERFEFGIFVEKAFVFERLRDLLDKSVPRAGGVSQGGQDPDG